MDILTATWGKIEEHVLIHYDQNYDLISAVTRQRRVGRLRVAPPEPGPIR